jgi:hypothetical protein
MFHVKHWRLAIPATECVGSFLTSSNKPRSRARYVSGPKNFVLASTFLSDHESRGNWIPGYRFDQYGETLAHWFGVRRLTAVFPNRPNFGANQTLALSKNKNHPQSMEHFHAKM